MLYRDQLADLIDTYRRHGKAQRRMIAWRNRRLIANPELGPGSTWDTRSFDAFDRHSDAMTATLATLRDYGFDHLAAALKREYEALAKIARQHHYGEPVDVPMRAKLTDARRVIRVVLCDLPRWRCADTDVHTPHQWTGPGRQQWVCPGMVSSVRPGKYVIV